MGMLQAPSSAQISVELRLTEQHRRVFVPTTDLAQCPVWIHAKRTHLYEAAVKRISGWTRRVALPQLTLHRSWSTLDLH